MRTSGSRKWVNLKSSCKAYAQRVATSMSNPLTARVTGTHVHQRQQPQNVSPIFSYCPSGRVALTNPRGSARLGLSDRICRGAGRWSAGGIPKVLFARCGILGDLQSHSICTDGPPGTPLPSKAGCSHLVFVPLSDLLPRVLLGFGPNQAEL